VNKKPTIHRNIRNFQEPIEFFRALWTREILVNVCASTKTFKIKEKRKKLTPEILEKFFGLELMRGYLGIRNIAHLWTTEEITISYPGKETALTRDQFYAISKCLNFEPSVVHEILVARFKLHIVPGYHVTVDELRIPCHHEKCPEKNHNRDKPDIWAIESKSLHADNSYLVDFVNPIQKNIPTPTESVFQFAEYLKTTTRRHHLIMDSNFLNALDLLKLKDMNFEATASCKSTRPSFIWKDGLVPNLPVSYTRVASSKRLCCLATKNKGIPKIATTLCIAKESKTSLEVKERRKPLNMYDKYKGQADRFGHLYKSQYNTGKHKSWITTLLLGWFYFALTNAYILYSMRFDDLSHHEFVFQIAKDLV
jgi:hypothetical protein